MKTKLAEAMKILLPLLRELKTEQDAEPRMLIGYAIQCINIAGEFSFEERKAILLSSGADPELVEAAASVAKAQDAMTKLARAKSGDAEKKDDDTLN